MRKLSLKELNRVDVSSFKEQSKTPIRIILDNVRSALNVGSAFRTADAFALEHIYLCGITAQPPHREILKTAIGATESVNWSYHQDVENVVEKLREEGVLVYGVEQVSEPILLQDFQPKPDQTYALVFGNEVKGVSDTIIPLLDACIEVPQFGTKHSLNISVCLGVVTWDIFSKLNYNSFNGLTKLSSFSSFP